MVTLGPRNVAIAIMLALLVFSPYALTTGQINQTFDPIVTFELAAPTITGPSTYQFENGSVGHIITYKASDPNPKNYTVFVGEQELDTGLWDGGDITVYLAWLYRDNLIVTLPQVLTMVCTVYNQEGESASATTTITVILDESAPIIAQPSNITYEYGSFGHEILWNITESNPDFYNISRTSNEPTSNSTVLEFGDWNGDNISINVDGLNASRWYLYSLFVNDTFGYNATSYVNVTVVPDTTFPTITSPDDISYEFGAVGHEILWHAYDSNPKNYSITAVILYNDTTYGDVVEFTTFTDIFEPSWSFSNPDGEDISVSVDALFLGNYTITLTLFDIYNRMTKDSVNVTIYKDIRAPIITSSGNLEYEEGYTGNSINWTAEESNPWSFNLTLDGQDYANGTWDGEAYTIDVDGFEVGTYVYNMTYTDFFNQSAFSIIQVEVTPDAHIPILRDVTAIQTFSTSTKNNLTIIAYAWDLNNISSIEVSWGVGNPEDAEFEYETIEMVPADIGGFFTAFLGEFQHGVVVWYKVVAHDNAQTPLEHDTGWIAEEITSQGINRVPAVLYAVVVVLGSLSLLVILVIYFRTRTKVRG
jgi:hypothetical protein